ncbi:MAG: YibE/F family protein [bacterium]|nr:YibE/F family protein [bacterium]
MLKPILLFLSVIYFAFPGFVQGETTAQDEFLEGEIVSVSNRTKTDPTGQRYIYQDLSVKIYQGSLEGEVVSVVHDAISTAEKPQYEQGDKVMLLHSQNLENDGSVFYITDHVRRDGLMVLFLLFAALAIAVGGRWGAASLLGMAFSFFVLFAFILPQLLAGRSAVLTAILGAAMIIPVTFSLSHGFKPKTLIAGIGTVFTLLLTGLLATFAVKITHLTGFGSEEAAFVQFQMDGAVQIGGLLLAGMIIASLGILDDITISQASVVAELKKANKGYGFFELFQRGMRVGRDHIASLINTLVLVYAGASLPLLLLFTNNPSPFAQIVNAEIIAEEIVRTLVASTGLILAVPVTTLLAAYWYQRKK